MIGKLFSIFLKVAIFFGLFWLFFPPVTTLPLGVDIALQHVSDDIYSVRTMFPMLTLFWNYFLAFLAVEFAFYLWPWVKWIISHIF